MNSAKTTGFLAATLGLILINSASAATIETFLFNEESDLINTGGTVHSAVHFGPGAGDPDPLVVNGIAHTGGTASDANLTFGGTGGLFEGDFRNGETGFPQDGSNIIQVLYSGIAGWGISRCLSVI